MGSNETLNQIMRIIRIFARHYAKDFRISDFAALTVDVAGGGGGGGNGGRAKWKIVK